MTTISVPLNTAPIACFVVAGAIVVALMYSDSFGHIDALFNGIFIVFAICFLLIGVALYWYAKESYYQARRDGTIID